MIKNILKNRTVLGLICIVLSLVVCFGITPLFNNAINAQSNIIRVKTDISKGTQVTDSMIETVRVGSYNLPADVLKDKGKIVGKYATADMQIGDYILTGKLSDNPLTDSPYLTELDGNKVAISIAIPSFAAGLSGKLEAGDIISVISTDTDTGATSVPNELRYVKVLAATTSDGSDKAYAQADTNNTDNKDSSEKSLPSTLTLLVNMEQAQLLADLEVNSKIHAALVYRGTNENADNFLDEQDKYFEKTGNVTQPNGNNGDVVNTEITQQEDGGTDGN